MGSSPLTRGKCKEPHWARRLPRLIPAHAGKMRSLPRLRRLLRAHPRSRGENYASAAFGEPVSGSSPLTRGKLSKSTERGPARGLIPAHAGKTFGVTLVENCIGAHPRSRGENSQWKQAVLAYPGSSPLTRGKPRTGIEPGFITGLIPAHAGKTRNHPLKFNT